MIDPTFFPTSLFIPYFASSPFQSQPSLQILIWESQNSLLNGNIRQSQALKTITTISVPLQLYHKCHQSPGHHWGMTFGGNHRSTENKAREEQSRFSLPQILSVTPGISVGGQVIPDLKTAKICIFTKPITPNHTLF